MSCSIILAANRGDIGGGEVMLLHLAGALHDLGVDVLVVGPEKPSDLLQGARDHGFAVEVVPATDRRSYLLNLRAWDKRHRGGTLWCNGLLPAVATTGHPDRVVHLHQRPTENQRLLARSARAGALATVVPSLSMAESIPGSIVVPNFVPSPHVRRQFAHEFRIGFLGRPSPLKGTDVLGHAVARLEKEHPAERRLVVGGAPRFIADDDAAEVRRVLESLSTPVDVLGWVPPEEFLGRVDVLVAPSRVPESFGLVAVEAMAAEVPVIVSDAGALPEVLGPDHAWIVPAGDTEALAEALRRVETAGAAEVEHVVRAARDRWARRYSPAAGRRNLRHLLQSLGLPIGTSEEGVRP